MRRRSVVDDNMREPFWDPRDADSLWTVPCSTFYEFSMERFDMPAFGVVESHESVESLLNKSWRYKRNRMVAFEAREIRKDSYDSTERGAFDQTAVFHIAFDQVKHLLFHPYENMLVAADGKNNIAVWEYNELEQINRFSNKNPRGTHLSSIHFVNDMHVSLLLTAADDGVVRVWKDPHLAEAQRLVSSWIAYPMVRRHRHSTTSSSSRKSAKPTATPERVVASSATATADSAEAATAAAGAARSNSSGSYAMVVDWQQRRGHVVASGVLEKVRVWDVEQEICVSEVSVRGAREESVRGVTSIRSSADGNLVMVGCGDGSIRMLDLRSPDHGGVSIAACLRKHRSRVIKLDLQRGGIEGGRVVSASSRGLVMMTDLRMSSESVKKLVAHQHHSLDSMAIHNYAPIVATGSHNQFFKVFDMDGTTLNIIRYHEGFLGQRIGPVSSLCFHPHKLLLAAGALDSFVSIHSALK
eukprot:TRINITY_DN66046_c3_g1_i1.p2 TRINITY_DN66046_c3_g1~~TRINITY_DN66046_c3_g1_i1.p2  ORF type:complete len:470 (-),score=242.51 TRINITY_DN66046_c3_g1_i1:104-1513(-)